MEQGDSGENLVKLDTREELEEFLNKIFNIDGKRTRREDVFRGLQMYDNKLVQYLEFHVAYHGGQAESLGFAKIIAKVLRRWTTEEYRRDAITDEELAEEISIACSAGGKRQRLIPDHLVEGMVQQFRSTYDAALQLLDGKIATSATKLVKILTVMIGIQFYLLSDKFDEEERPAELTGVTPIVQIGITFLDLPKEWRQVLQTSFEEREHKAPKQPQNYEEKHPNKSESSTKPITCPDCKESVVKAQFGGHRRWHCKGKKKGSSPEGGGGSSAREPEPKKAKRQPEGEDVEASELEVDSDEEEDGGGVTQDVSRTLERMLRAEVKAAARLLANKVEKIA